MFLMDFTGRADGSGRLHRSARQLVHVGGDQPL